MVISLDHLAWELHETAKEKGFWDDEVNAHFVLAKLALVGSEVSEVLEAYRKQQGSEKIVEEMADIIIRLLDLYQGLLDEDIVEHSLDEIVALKAGVNKTRPVMHGNLL